MSLRVRIFIILSIIVLFILAVSIFLFVRGKQKNDLSSDVQPTSTVSNNNSSGQIAQPGATVIPAGTPVKPLTAEEMEKNSVEQIAKIVVERYGTYSTDNEFQNILEVKTLVTPALWTKISAAMKTKNTNTVFFGITTKVASTQISDWSGDAATVVLKTVRTENKNGSVKNMYQDVTVGMKKTESVWLANTLTWN
jgi:hypothetical protein